MKDKSPAISSGFPDKLKWVGAILLVVGATYAHYTVDTQVSLKLIAWLFVAAATIGILVTTVKGATTLVFFKEARQEIRKVVWPTRAETIQTTFIVFVMVVVMGIILWGMDSFFLWAIGYLTGQKG